MIFDDLKLALRNEVTHMLFYLQSSVCVHGVSRPQLHDFFTKAAQNEMRHTQKFANMLLGFNQDIDLTPLAMPYVFDPDEIVNVAITLESEVVENYANMLKVVEESNLTETDKRWLIVFLEGQLEDSREDLDFLKLMKSITPIP